MSFGAPFSPKPGFVRELDPVRIPVMFGLESNLSGKQTALMSGNLRYLLHSRSHSCPGIRSWFHPGLVRVLNFSCPSPNTFCPGNDLPRVRDFHAPPNAVHSSARGSQLVLVLVREPDQIDVRDSILCFNPDSVLYKNPDIDLVREIACRIVRVFNPVHFLFDALLSGNQVAFQTGVFTTFSINYCNLVREMNCRMSLNFKPSAIDHCICLNLVVRESRCVVRRAIQSETRFCTGT